MTFTKPTIILFRGMPGVGKTFISDKIAEKLQIAILRKDDIYDSIYLSVETHERRNKVCYDLIYQIIDTNLKARTSLLIDCPFREQNDLDKLNDFVLSRKGCFKPILCECNNHVIWALRFNKRSINPKPNNLLTDFNTLKAHYKTLHLNPYRDELVLDTQQDITNLIKKVEDYL